MCRYCEKDERKKRDYIINSPVVSLKIIKKNNFNALELKSYNKQKEIIDNYKIINYCPMCGRRLGE